ncbi:MAG: nitroreductase family protein [Pseudomonadota bacterium]
MELFDAIEHRRSVRQFENKKAIDDAVLQKILHAAMMAPSSGNTQCWRFIVVRDPNIKKRLALEAGHQGFIDQAPVAIVVCADLERAASTYGERGFGTYSLQDAAAATENMLLAAHALGLGACWVGAFDEKMASNILELPKGLRPLAIIPIGFSAEPTKRVPPRRKLDEVVDFR